MSKNPVISKSGRIPKEVAALLGPPVLVRGESREEYDAYLLALARAVRAEDIIVWSWCSDIAYQNWEGRRFQRIRAGLILEAQVSIIEDLLKTTYDPGQERRQTLYDVLDAKNEARRWATDAGFASKVDDRLATRGHDRNSVLAKAYSLCAPQLAQVDRSIANLEARRMMTLREIARHDAAMAKRLDQVSSEIIEGDFTQAAE